MATPLRVLIVGAGIGGLSAGLALRRQGHNVTIIEKSKFAAEIGAAIHSASNCSRVLRRLGVYPEKHGGTPLTGMLFCNSDGQVMGSRDYGSEKSNNSEQEYFLLHRAHLHQSLKDAVLSEEGPGTPAELHLACRIVALDTEKATLALEDGRQFSGDLIVGADGVHSWTRSCIDATIKPFHYGSSCYRWLAPNEDLAKHEATLALSKKKGTMVEWSSGPRRILYYPCADHTISNFGGFIPGGSKKGDHTAPSDWNNQGSKDHLLEMYQDFGPEVQQILRGVPEGELKLWDLMDMSSLPTWHKDSLVLIGDAAHPFLPFMGQGGAMAIEDAAALGALLPLGTTPAQVSARLSLWETCRRERVELIQKFTRRNGQSADDPTAPRPSYDESMKYVAYCISHDAWENAAKALSEQAEA
ncbi:hypothetical protein BJ166DRAFT_55910 [Pestalotiopsis sp. NC0098]|nr:hypothetical protein BJ166DRAFT_55910 [Pestalotiopsis sp. NC0098]